MQQCGTPQWILDAGCGRCEDIHTLRSVFPAAHIVGVDLDFAALQAASRWTHNSQSRVQTLWLLNADLGHLPFHLSFDLILLRHPDIHRRAELWKHAAGSLLGCLAPAGRLLATTYTAAEMALLSDWLALLETADVGLDAALLAPVNLHGRDKVARLFRLPTA